MCSAEEQSVRLARHAIRDVLGRWQLTRLIDVCQLVASELVTNAVRYGRPPISLLLRRRSNEVRLDVHDALPHLGSIPGSEAPLYAEGGRGLEIVRAVSDDSGVDEIFQDGKNVFAFWELIRLHKINNAGSQPRNDIAVVKPTSPPGNHDAT
jgi:anti-sigma regulatory factor (Ser/Thr protein kinase)